MMKPKKWCLKVSLAEDELLGMSIYDQIMDHFHTYSRFKNSENTTGLAEAREIINENGFDRLTILREGIKREA